MRALLVVPASPPAQSPSHAVHAELVARALCALAVDATVVSSDAPDARGYDVAHVFGIADPTRAARQFAEIRSAGVPLVLSPMWHDPRVYLAVAPWIERALGAARPATVERRLERARERERARYGELEVERTLLLAADVVIAGSEVEAYLYGDRLHLTRLAYAVAPLGVDDDAFAVDRPATRAGVLCVGDIGSRANQAALLYALRDVDTDVTVLGRATDERYLALCQRWATPRTRFVEGAPHDEMLRLMSRSAVHARPSWLDAPGHSALEAAATGARIVCGDRGCEREYFGPQVEYADPADPASIRAAVVQALGRPPRDRGDSLDRRLGKNTWERHAELTLEAYARAMVIGGA